MAGRGRGKGKARKRDEAERTARNPRRPAKQSRPATCAAPAAAFSSSDLDQYDSSEVSSDGESGDEFSRGAALASQIPGLETDLSDSDQDDTLPDDNGPKHQPAPPPVDEGDPHAGPPDSPSPDEIEAAAAAKKKAREDRRKQDTTGDGLKLLLKITMGIESCDSGRGKYGTGDLCQLAAVARTGNGTKLWVIFAMN